MRKPKKHLCQDHKINTTLHYALYNIAQNFAYTHILNSDLFPTTAVEQRQHVD